MIAVDAVSGFVGDGDVVFALYGSTAVRFYMNPGPDAPPPEPVRLSDGLLAGPRNWRRTNVSAVITISELAPWTVAVAVPTWWVHPEPSRPAPPPPAFFRQAHLNRATRQIEYSVPTDTPGEYFGLEDGWPFFRSRA